jgi:hypothetical protein
MTIFWEFIIPSLGFNEKSKQMGEITNFLKFDILNWEYLNFGWEILQKNDKNSRKLNEVFPKK